MEKIDLKSIDKTTWQTYRFDQIAEKISETVDPGETDLSIYIGLEHLDSENIHIKRRGIPSDVSGGKLKCYPGDIIFGKRRAYQRKAAIVNFKGICSAHAFVLRAIPEVIDPKLFPFFLHSDSFMHCAVDISVGGLSPTINWGQLKEQEFLLPPKYQQAKLTEFLWAMDEVIESQQSLFKSTEVIESLSLADLFSRSRFLNEIPIKDLYKNKFKSLQPSEFSDLVLHYSLPSFIETHEPEKVQGDTIKSNKLLIDKDTVLFSKLNPFPPKIWAITGVTEHQRLGSTEWLPVLPNKDFSVSFIVAYLSSQIFLQKVLRYVQGTSNSHKRVDPTRFYELKIPLVSEEDRNRIVNCLVNFQNSKKRIVSSISKSKALQKSLINQIF